MIHKGSTLKLSTILTPLLLLGLFAGCGVAEVEDDTAVDNTFVPQADNCDDGIKNSYGCYGSDQGLGEEMLVEGYWSVYTQRDIGTEFDYVYYDTYLYGYRFFHDGTVVKRDATTFYSESLAWGVDENGESVTLKDDGTYSITGQFENSENCYEVTNDDSEESLKLCHESAVDNTNQNGSGFFGSTVVFGNYHLGDHNASGTWLVSDYDGSSSTTAAHTLSVDGSTGSGGEWGVSADGKMITIDGISYLIFKYLVDSDCIAAFEMSGNNSTGEIWQFCRQ